LVRGKITTPKSGKARQVGVSPTLREALGELRDKLSPWEEPGYVFLSPTGKRWDERNFARAFDRLRTRALKAENVRPLHFHCARHTFASWALEGGQSIKWVQSARGHASAEITLRTYAHLMPSTEDELDFLSTPEPDQNRTKPDQTGPNRTKPDQTGPNRTNRPAERETPPP
jgi:integrase